MIYQKGLLHKIKLAEATSDLQSRSWLKMKIGQSTSNCQPSSLSAISNTSFVAYPPYTPTLTPSHVNETVLVNQEKDTSHKIIINLLQQIKEQNQQILYRMNKQDSATCSSNLPEIPVPLPLKDCQELGIFEEYVAEREHSFHVSDYLSTLGGRDSTA
ncbi:hypothetical protein FQR65_LT19667 [Abscondita terminalis]|nr:hypothetical protein FQR65_LT19667 [Abscondita terminalis]